jgi:hypothetical protein
MLVVAMSELVTATGSLVRQKTKPNGSPQAFLVCDSLHDVASGFQKMEQKQLAETLASAGQIEDKSGGRQRVSGEPCLVIRRKRVAQE